MGVLYSIPLCSRGTVKDASDEDSPNTNVDDNNNDPTLVINNQPVILPPSTKITNSQASVTPPNATSTPKRSGSCSSDAHETGFENENAENFAIDNTGSITVMKHRGQNKNSNIYCDDNAEEDDIGPVVDQVIGSSSDDDLDSGLETSTSVERTLDAFRRRHNLDIIDADRAVMTPPPPALHPSHTLDDAFDDCFDEVLCNDDEDYDGYDDANLQRDDDDESDTGCSISDDATIDIENVDSRDLSCSDTDPVERCPEPQPLQSETSRDVSPFSASSNASNKDIQESLDDPEVSAPLYEYISKPSSATTHAITNILSELVGDAPHNDHHTTVAISR